eukprot:14644176-Alexandrium_andersonii.AAC.1
MARSFACLLSSATPLLTPPLTAHRASGPSGRCPSTAAGYPPRSRLAGPAVARPIRPPDLPDEPPAAPTPGPRPGR